MKPPPPPIHRLAKLSQQNGLPIASAASEHERASPQHLGRICQDGAIDHFCPKWRIVMDTLPQNRDWRWKIWQAGLFRHLQNARREVTFRSLSMIIAAIVKKRFARRLPLPPPFSRCPCRKGTNERVWVRELNACPKESYKCEDRCGIH